MAKITVAGDAVVITSTMKLEDIRIIEKYRPDALILKGEKDEPIFAIGVTSGAGNINSVGVSFGRETHDVNKLACVTISGTGIKGDTDIASWVADEIGGAVINLNKLEARLPEVLESINAERREIMNNITIA